MLPPPDSPLGDLEIDEVFIDYDGPQLFSCRSDQGAWYVAVHVPPTEGGDNWLYALTTPIRLQRFKDDRIDLREILTKPSKGQVYVITFAQNGEVSVNRLVPSQIPEEFLPRPRVQQTAARILEDIDVDFRPANELPPFLVKPSDMWELSRPALDYLKSIRTPVNVAAARTGRIVADLVLRPGEHRTDLPIAVLGSLLSTAQKLIDVLGQPDSAAKGPVKAAIQQWTRFDAVAVFPSSFGLRIESHQSSTIADTEGERALHQFLRLLAAARNAEQLRAILLEVGRRPFLQYRAFAKALYRSDADFVLEVGFPDAFLSSKERLSRDEIAALQGILEEAEIQNDEFIEVRGRLLAVSLKTKFFLIENSDGQVSGRVADECMPLLDHIVINADYAAKVRVITEVNDASGEESYKFILVNIQEAK